MRSLFLVIISVLSVFSGFASAAATVVVVEFGPAIERRLDRLEVYELRRERLWRDRWSVPRTRSPANWYAYSSATERLIPDLREFSVPEVARRMAAYNLEAIGEHEKDKILVIRIDDFYGQNFGIGSFQGPHALIKGEMTLLDADGNIEFQKRVWTSPATHTQSGGRYEESGHPFPRGDFQARFAPLYAVFLQKAMSDVYPTAEIPQVISRRSWSQ